MRSHFVCILLLVWLQNNNLERALDWIFTHPDCEDESEAMSDTADTEPNDNSFSNTNAHSDSSLSPDQDLSSPRVRDGPGRKCLQNTEFNKQWSTHTEDYTACIYCWFDISLLVLLFIFIFQRLRTVCLHQSHGIIHNVWSLCVSYQKRGQVCWL